MTGLKDLLASERGVLSTVAIIAATVLCALGRISNVEWLAFTAGITGTFTISKTVTGVAEIKNPKPVVAVLDTTTPPGGS